MGDCVEVRVTMSEQSRVEQEPSDVESAPVVARIVCLQIRHDHATDLLDEVTQRLGQPVLTISRVRHGHVVIKEVTTKSHLHMTVLLAQLQIWATGQDILMTVLPEFTTETFKCTNCNGHATVMKGREGSHTDIMCPSCGGSGQPDTMPCPACKGHKRVFLESGGLLSHGGFASDCRRCDANGYVPRR